VGKGTGVSIGIMADGGELLLPGKRGEVVIKGPNVITGYENNPTANAESFPAGWFRTGDLGVMDDAGYLTLISRIKELINRGGEKIAPGEIDAVLRLHPDVREAVAFGMPHKTWGEEVGAAVVLHPEAQATARDLIAHCRDRLADFKVPREIFITDVLPRTATGKIQRRHVAAALLPGL
jgi:acyl-CoA synthetase (AMP-forming)/AMP-acid ligase II